MLEEEILKLWKSGLSKTKVAEIYRRRYNQNVKLIRAEVVNRYAGKFISYMDALAVVERIIYKHIKKASRN